MAILFQFIPNTVPVFTAVMGLFLVLFGLSSAIVKERLYLSEAVLTTLIGTLVGPYCFNLFNPLSWPDINTIVLEFTRLIIAMQIMAAIVCLPTQYFKIHWKSMLMLLGPVMIISWLVTAGIVHWIVAVPFPVALAISAALTPTDPILANSIVKGKFADRHVPRHVRHLLSAESAVNDSTAALFILLAVYMIKYNGDAGKIATEFFLWVVLYEVGLGAIYGAFCGYFARVALKYAQDHDFIDQENFLAFSLALSVFVDGSSVLLFFNDFVGVVCAAMAFNWDGSFYEQTKESPFQEILDNLANAWLFVFNGAIIPWTVILNSSDPNMPRFWQYLVTGILILLFRRIPITTICYRFMPSLTTHKEALFVGHFGPMAAGAVYYMAFIRQKLDVSILPAELEPTIQFVVVCSILVHGCTIPFFKLGSVAVRTLSVSSSLGRRRSFGSRSQSLVVSTSNKGGHNKMTTRGVISVSSPINARPMYSTSTEMDLQASPENMDDSRHPNPNHLLMVKRETTIEIREVHDLHRHGDDDDNGAHLSSKRSSLVPLPVRGNSAETIVAK